MLADPSGYLAGIPGEEYVTPGYSPIVFDPQLEAVRTALYGGGYDRAMANYRLREILYVAHSTELAPYATLPDPRITYYPAHEPRLFRDTIFGAGAAQIAGSACPITFQGDQASFVSPTLLNKWTVAVLSSSQVLVTKTGYSSDSAVFNYTTTGGLSSPVPLLGSPLSVVFGPQGLALPLWNITAMARPAQSFLSTLQALRGAGADALFAGSNAEPYATLEKLWFQPELPVPHRIAVAALALGLRISDSYPGLAPQYSAPTGSSLYFEVLDDAGFEVLAGGNSETLAGGDFESLAGGATEVLS